MSPLVDTLQATRQLENAGIGSAQAEAIVTIVAHAGTRLATKDDIERLEASTKKDIRRLEASTKEDIQRLEASTKEDIQRLEASTKKDIQGLRTELVARMDAKIAEVRQDISTLRAELTDTFSKQMNRHQMVTVTVLGLLFVALRFT